jgi:hypothetical protein
LETSIWPYNSIGEVTKIISLQTISSGSGIEFYGNSWYVVSDDVNSIYKLDDDFNIIESLPYESTATVSRIEKAFKKDIEMLTSFLFEGKNYLLAAGSGSVKSKRELAFQFDSNSIIPLKINLSELYDQYRMVLNLSNPDLLNLEGLAASEENLYWFQRGNVTGCNAIITISIESFFDYISKNKLPDCSVKYFELPKIDEILTGFSGGTFLQNPRGLLFCATSEDTMDTYNDGKILGSIIGFIAMDGGEFQNPTMIKIEKNGIRFKNKLESIAVKEKNDKHLLLVGVCDNDDGSTLLLEIEMKANC